MLRIQDKIRKGGDRKAFDDHTVAQVVVTSEGNHEAFLPKSQDVIEVRRSHGDVRDCLQSNNCSMCVL
jgi:hypothetical protein